MKARVLLPFVCPVCAGANGADLLALSRAGGADCAACGKWLRAADVMRAIHSPREAAQADAPERRVRAPPPQRAEMVWPPTAASRATIAPLYRRKGGGR